MTEQKEAAGTRTRGRKGGASSPQRAERLADGSLVITPGSPPDLMCRVALDLFADQNYQSVTIKDIAVACAINPSLIYYYFENKEDLFMKTIARIVEEAFEHFGEITKNDPSPEKVITEWIELHIRQYVKLQKVAKMSLDYASTHNRTPLVDRAIRDFYEKEADVLGRAIAKGIQNGEFAPVNPAETALFISTFLDGALFRNVMFPNFNYSRAIKTMRRIVLDHLRGGRAAGKPG
ncbi:TetR family transcriptional regulator [Rhodobacterales bacterium HKCCE2091]|nr:TetR family transcriptional regulator [Rhodobacterales bacterium HKCCE2091]